MVKNLTKLAAIILTFCKLNKVLIEAPKINRLSIYLMLRMKETETKIMDKSQIERKKRNFLKINLTMLKPLACQYQKSSNLKKCFMTIFLSKIK